MVASLAVVVACSLGATTLPLGPAAAAHPAPRPVAVDPAMLGAGQAGPAGALPAGHRGADPIPALRAGHPGLAGADPAARGLIRWSGRAAEAMAGAEADRPAVRAGAGSAAATGAAASGSLAAGDPQAVPISAPPARGAVVAPADRHRVPAGPAPAATGSRAPPAR